MELVADKKNSKALEWLEKANSSMIQDARLAAAVVRMYTVFEKLQEAHEVLDKVQKKFMDPQLYKAAAQLYLSARVRIASCARASMQKRQPRLTRRISKRSC